jgi:hypothetical protein
LTGVAFFFFKFSTNTSEWTLLGKKGIETRNYGRKCKKSNRKSKKLDQTDTPKDQTDTQKDQTDTPKMQKVKLKK